MVLRCYERFCGFKKPPLSIDSKSRRGQTLSTESGVRVGAFLREANAASSSLSRDSNG